MYSEIVKHKNCKLLTVVVLNQKVVTRLKILMKIQLFFSYCFTAFNQKSTVHNSVLIVLNCSL